MSTKKDMKILKQSANLLKILQILQQTRLIVHLQKQQLRRKILVNPADQKQISAVSDGKAKKTGKKGESENANIAQIANM